MVDAKNLHQELRPHWEKVLVSVKQVDVVEQICLEGIGEVSHIASLVIWHGHAPLTNYY